TEELSALRQNRGALYGSRSPGRSRAYRRHISLDETKRQRPEQILADYQEPTAGTTLFAQDVLVRLSGLGESEGEEDGRSHRLFGQPTIGERRYRCQTVVHGKVCLESGAARSGLDYLPLESIPGERYYRETDSIGLAE